MAERTCLSSNSTRSAIWARCPECPIQPLHERAKLRLFFYRLASPNFHLTWTSPASSEVVFQWPLSLSPRKNEKRRSYALKTTEKQQKNYRRLYACLNRLRTALQRLFMPACSDFVGMLPNLDHHTHRLCGPAYRSLWSWPWWCCHFFPQRSTDPRLRSITYRNDEITLHPLKRLQMAVMQQKLQCNALQYKPIGALLTIDRQQSYGMTVWTLTIILKALYVHYNSSDKAKTYTYPNAQKRNRWRQCWWSTNRRS